MPDSVYSTHLGMVAQPSEWLTHRAPDQQLRRGKHRGRLRPPTGAPARGYGPVAREMITAAARSRSSRGSTRVAKTGSHRSSSRARPAACSADIRCTVERWAIRQARSSAAPTRSDGVHVQDPGDHPAGHEQLILRGSPRGSVPGRAAMPLSPVPISVTSQRSCRPAVGSAAATISAYGAQRVGPGRSAGQRGHGRRQGVQQHDHVLGGAGHRLVEDRVRQRPARQLGQHDAEVGRGGQHRRGRNARRHQQPMPVQRRPEGRLPQHLDEERLRPAVRC